MTDRAVAAGGGKPRCRSPYAPSQSSDSTRPRLLRQQLACLRQGDRCPRCKKAKLDYDGLIQLSCLHCGFVADPGGFT